MTALSTRALNRATLARQMLLARERVDVVTAVARLAGMQAQIPKPPFLGLAARIEGFDADELRRAIAGGALVRATLMRGTLHLVTKKDFVAWRNALQPVLTAAVRTITKDAVDVERVGDAARKLLAKGPRTFEEIREHLVSLFPDANDRWLGYTVRMHLPLTMVPDDSAYSFPSNSAFALFGGKLAKADPAPLALRYLAAFGPATPADFATWSGLRDTRAVFDELRPRLVTFRDERKRELFDLAEAPRPAEETPAPPRLLPEFDNLLLAHADRARIIADADRPRIATKNLRIPQTFLVDGFVAGTWKLEKKKLVLEPFGKLTRAVRDALEAEAQAS
jgi:hypothetical protein